MQVFQKQQSLLGGIDEAIAILKLGAGRLGTAGEWTPGCDELWCTHCTRVTRSHHGRR